PEKNAGVIPAAEFEAKQEAIMPYAGADNGFEFTVTPDNLSGIYYDGDDMSMSVYSARECWFKITHVDKHGNTSVLYPSRPRDDNRIMAGQTRRIPERTRYRMHAPYGEEYILVAAYAAPFAFQSFAEEPVSREAIRRSLYENDSRPIVTAWFSYTIMPKR
ncbi:MAG: DUF4384 domain-containing protein, partial [Spirochaetaceae bacterium]|nr:DUF4384 domain-containing protein [Spirochaetaceae bacterium]